MKRSSSVPGVSVIVCTNRPQFFENILRNFRTQSYRNKELIIILNKDSMKVGPLRRKLHGDPNITIYQVPERISLGQCLNCGISRARYPLIAKFDDDDYYAPAYLKEQVGALIRTRSDLVGKHACLVYLAASRKLIVRSPEEQHKRVEFVQGGTILFRRRVARQVLFPDRSLGEDVAFLKKSTQKGFVCYATSPYRYVYIRRKDKGSHTWKAGDRFYLQGSRFVAVTDDYRSVADRRR